MSPAKMPAGGEPPLRTSSWSWSPWKSRSRRNSESSGSPPAAATNTTKPVKTGGRNSLSSIDHRNAESVRNDVAEVMAAAAKKNGGILTAEEIGGGVTYGGGAGATRPTRRSASHPPLAYYNSNRQYHQRTFSADPVRPISNLNNDAALLTPPPPPRFRNLSSVEPTAGLVPTARPSLSAPRAMPDELPLFMYPPKEHEFVIRTQRASARMQQATDTYPAPQASPDHDMGEVVIDAIPVELQNGTSWPSLDRMGIYEKPQRFSIDSTISGASSAVSGRESFDSRIRNPSYGSQTSVESSPVHTPGSSPQTSHLAQKANQEPRTYNPYRPTAIKGTRRPDSIVSGSLTSVSQRGSFSSSRQAISATNTGQLLGQRRKAKPGEQFATLPGEVLELILDYLRKYHFRPGSSSCATCWMRDCCSVALSARKFLKYVREALYSHIQLDGPEGHHMKKRTRLAHGCRLVLLRRTLRSNPQIAVIVRSLKPPALPSSATVEGYNDLVASVVMACPNFERLVGFYPSYNHSFQRIFHALSTRPKLKEMDWIVNAVPSQRLPKVRPASSSHHSAVPDLQPNQAQDYVDFHLNWQHLTTLVVHCNLGATLSPNKVFQRALQCLPSLQNLHLSHLPPTSFNDLNLLYLPPLKKLSLSHLAGVTTAGLSSMATRTSSSSITTLTLIHINVETLPALARIFSNLTSLKTFNIVQAYAPNMPSDEFVMLFPYLASQSLQKLHWDIPYLPTRATTADNILAKSISAGGFPSLRSLRVGNDPEGLFQALCKPVERADHPTDRYRGGKTHRYTGLGGHRRSSSGHGSAPGSSHGQGANGSQAGRGGGFGVGASKNGMGGSVPVSPLFPPDALMMPRDNSNLHQARLAAQARLEIARRFPRYAVNVIDEEGVVVEKYGAGAFIGSVESKISYDLMPDAGATDEGGGLVTVADMLKDCGEALVLPNAFRGSPEEGGYSNSGGSGVGSSHKKDLKKKGGESGDHDTTRSREGCIGRWNTYSGPVVDKKDKERWFHVERGRWRGVVLS